MFPKCPVNKLMENLVIDFQVRSIEIKSYTFLKKCCDFDEFLKNMNFKNIATVLLLFFISVKNNF